MNEEVSKLFDRSFFIGFFSPALYFVIGSLILFYCFDVHLPGIAITLTGSFDQPRTSTAAHNRASDTTHKVDSSTDEKKGIKDKEGEASTESLKSATLIGGIALGISIFLMSLNREVFRMAEGYWPKSFKRVQSFLARGEIQRFQRLKKRIEDLESNQNQCDAEGKTFEHATLLNSLDQEFVRRFPDQEGFVLPTPFGNTVRAYETYSRYMYGIDAIPAWPRLQSVLPTEFANLIIDSRSRVNFWLNIWVLSMVLLIEWCVFEYRCMGMVQYFGIILLIVIPVAMRRAKSSAVQYGETIKAAFDVYLPELAKKIAPESIPPLADARPFWISYSQALIYRNVESMEDAQKRAKAYSALSDKNPIEVAKARAIIQLSRSIRRIAKDAAAKHQDRPIPPTDDWSI
jgi:hypothetical protein